MVVLFLYRLEIRLNIVRTPLETSSWNINNKSPPLSQLNFCYVFTRQLSLHETRFFPHKKKERRRKRNLLGHRAQIFITGICFRDPGACLAIHRPGAVERISKSSAPRFVAAAGEPRSWSIGRGSFEFSRTGCAPCAFQSPTGDTPTNYGRARWPPPRNGGARNERREKWYTRMVV